ncbi:unnamed protein product [Nippostrongylus brasiliensis]|uniref:MFS domain-containing protein n=1 Tax=Nippostrongylus brasiliensis TaxID=27835 RepID=A0A0N4YBR1_NIPBR|nr:unnamed protein product [Nippostrongylus brasiliensis]
MGRIPFFQCYYEEDCELDGRECEHHVYDRSRVKYSAVERWEISCSRGWIRASVQAMYYIGQMAGSMVFGLLGDRIGRKKVFLIAIFLQLTCGFAVVVTPWWWLFALFRAGLGFSHPGIFVIAVVIGAELVGPSYRRLAAVITGLFFAIGQVLLGVEAYFITDYRFLQLAIVSPAILFISYWWLVPESARWLVTQKRYEDADKVLQEAAKWNHATLPDKWWEQLDGDSDNSRSGKVVKQFKLWDLFVTPQLRKRALVTFFLWPVVSMVYYGMALKPNVLGGDIYINFIFAAVVEIPALILVYLLIDRIGRRMLLSCGTIARVGAISASYISLWIVESFGKVFMVVPFAVMAILAGLLTLLCLPETKGKPLPETIAEVEGGEAVELQEFEPLQSKDTTDRTDGAGPTGDTAETAESH